MARIVILGAGIGGMPMAYEMKALARAGDTVTVISESPKFHFVPSNPWVAVDWRKRDDIEIDIASALGKKGIESIIQAAKRVHPDDNQVELMDGTRVDYDYLVIATGPKLAFDEIEGLGPHGGHTQSICHVAHAENAKSAWDTFVQDPGPIVVGAAGSAGCFGPAYEMAMILDTDLRRRKIRDKVPMTYVTSEPYIGHMGLGGVGDSKGLMESTLRQRHIQWVTNAKVTSVEPGTVNATEYNDEGVVRKEHKLPFKFSMILPAFKGVDAVAGVPDLCNPRGFVLIDKHQRNPKYRNVFGIGVAAPFGLDLKPHVFGFEHLLDFGE
jgi:sulfide:quinone oxidoreductase